MPKYSAPPTYPLSLTKEEITQLLQLCAMSANAKVRPIETKLRALLEQAEDE